MLEARFPKEILPMQSARSVASRMVLVFGVLAGLALPLTAVAGPANGQSIQIPTLDGVGLASLAGALAMGGAWVMARKRNRKP
ncbi:MAG: IPTL-CTERM sorting domain-containing protein [Acidobacteriota bacterium]